MQKLRSLIGGLRELKPLRPIHPLIDAIEAALFGTDEQSSEAPHCVDGLDLKRYMSCAILALVPSALAAIYCYGWRMIAIIMVSYVTGMTVEVCFAAIRKHDIHEGFLVTGLIFPLTLPPTVPLWVVAVGVVFGTLFGKEVFGGTGRNIFNPALVGRLFITIAFPAIMTTAWQIPMSDAVTAATPLTIYKTGQTLTPLADLLLGRSAGSMGEGFRIGIILGGLFLMCCKVSDWRIPTCFLGAVLVFSGVGHQFIPEKIAPPLFQLCAGGLLYGAMFMATDPVTSPFTKAGKCVFGTLCGLLTVLIRSFSGYVEGVMFSIVILNSFVPIIDHLVLGLKYRSPKPATAVTGT